MSAVAATPGVRRRVRRVRQVFEHYGTTKVFTVVFAWLMPFVLIFTSSIVPKIPFQIHPIVFLCLGISVWAWTVRGPISIARTPIDNFFIAWVLLGLASQLWACLYLNRVLTDNDWFDYSKQIFTSWVIYRAAYSLTTVEPKVATNSLMRSILFFAAVACLIGLLQSRGPLQQQALDFAYKFGTNPDSVVVGAEIESPRPVGLFSGPNYFAFINLICCALITGITLGTGKRMKEYQAFLAVVATALFVGGSFVAQSRIALVLHAILLLIFLTAIAKMGKGRVFIFAIVGMVLSGLTLIALKSDLQFEYLTSIFDTGLKNDESYQLRSDAIRGIVDMAPELAPLGAGGNRFSMILWRTGDPYSKGNGPDSAFLQGFLDHGLPGVLHVFYLIWAVYWGVRLLKTNNVPYLERLRYVGWLILIFFILYSVSASRHQKPETGAYLWMVMGPVWACVKIQMATDRSGQTALPAKRTRVVRRVRRKPIAKPAR